MNKKEIAQVSGLLAVLVESAERSMKDAVIKQLRAHAKVAGEGSTIGIVLLEAISIVQEIPLTSRCQTSGGQSIATTKS